MEYRTQNGLFYLLIYFFGLDQIIYHYNELDEKHVFLSLLFNFETNNLGAKQAGVPTNQVVSNNFFVPSSREAGLTRDASQFDYFFLGLLCQIS